MLAKKNILPLVAVIMALIVSPVMVLEVYGSKHTADSGDNLTNEFLALGAALSGGVVWGLSGYVKNRRSDGKTNFKWDLMKNDLFIGLILGFVGFGLSASAGDNLPAIDGPWSFIAAVIAASGTIALADNYIVKGLLHKEK